MKFFVALFLVCALFQTGVHAGMVKMGIFTDASCKHQMQSQHVDVGKCINEMDSGKSGIYECGASNDIMLKMFTGLNCQGTPISYSLGVEKCGQLSGKDYFLPTSCSPDAALEPVESSGHCADVYDTQGCTGNVIGHQCIVTDICSPLADDIASFTVKCGNNTSPVTKVNVFVQNKADCSGVPDQVQTISVPGECEGYIKTKSCGASSGVQTVSVALSFGVSMILFLASF